MNYEINNYKHGLAVITHFEFQSSLSRFFNIKKKKLMINTYRLLKKFGHLLFVYNN